MSRARDFANIASTVSGDLRSQFLVRVATNTTLDIDTAGNTVVDYNSFGAVVQNQGSDYTIANNRYTCPSTGIYQFQARSRLDGIGSGYALNAIGPAGLATDYNGTGSAEIDALWASTYFLSGSPATNYESVVCSTVMKLTAGQTVQHYIVIQSDGSVTINNRGSAFSGVLIG